MCLQPMMWSQISRLSVTKSCLKSIAPKFVVNKETDSCLLHKMRVSRSACADWPRALQKHKPKFPTS